MPPMILKSMLKSILKSRGAALLLALTAAMPARAAWDLNMPVGVTSISREIYDLHMLVLWICVWIGIAVFGAMVYCMVKFRKSKGAVADRSIAHSTQAEITWTAIPTLILIFLAYKAIPAMVDIEDTRDADMTVKITGYQWKWQYDYLEDGVSFFSTLDRDSNRARQVRSGVDVRTVDNYLLEVDRPLVVPVDTRIRYLLTASDVIHAWWVPDLAIKRDAVPGYINEGWFQIDEPGIYRGQCAELCGMDHGFMPIVVHALPKEEYQAWLAEQNGGAVASAVR